MDPFNAFLGSFLFDGKPLQSRDEQDFLKILERPEKIQRMLTHRTSHTTGMILSSEELAYLVHLPDQTASELIGIDFVRGFKVPSRLQKSGRLLGHNDSSAKPQVVNLPDLKNRSIYMIGTSQRGKSTSLINQALEIIAQDQGLALIDPHRETAEKLLRLIPAGHHARVIYADFEDPQYCLCHNAFDEDDQANFGRLAVELVNSFKLIMDASSFHRMTHILAARGESRG